MWKVLESGEGSWIKTPHIFASRYCEINYWRIVMRVGHCAVIEFNSESDAKEEIKKFASARSTYFS